MATFYSTHQAAQRAAHLRATRADASKIHMTRRVARFLYTPTDAEVDGERIILGQLNIPNARIIPDQCKIRYSGSGTLEVKFKLQKSADLVTFVDLTAQTAAITAVTAPTTLAVPSGAGDTKELEHAEYLAILLNNGTSAVTLPATAGLIFEIVYDAEG